MKKIRCAIIILTLTALLCSCTVSPAESGETNQITEAVQTTEAASSSDTAGESPSVSKKGFVKDGQFVNYIENGQIKTIQGIDVSEFNTDVDFEAVKNAGIDFVMVRLGGRGYGENGAMYKDENALDNIKAAKEAGLKVGGYFFSQATTPLEAAEEAEFAINLLNGESLDMPVAFDWETVENDEARTDGLSDEALTDCAAAFCSAINESGKYISVIYAKLEVFSRYNKEKLKGCDFWYSEYADAPSVYGGYTMWQYSETAEISGVGTTDLNLCFYEEKNYEQN